MRTAASDNDPLTAYRRPADDVLASLATDGNRGLSGTEAQARLSRHGRNELAADKPDPAWRKFLRQFQDVLVILLLTATAISLGLWLYEGESALPYEAIAIFSIVLLNAVMGYVQTSRAEQAVAALRAMSAAEATVLREGERGRVPAAEIVPGDVILIEEGDTISADARMIESTALQTAEAALTGESLPVLKDTAAMAGEITLGDRRNMIFSGTAATYGRGKAVVVATGMQTEIGLIVIVIAVVMIAIIILVEHVTGFSAIFDVLILGVALAVAAVPEGLPAIVTAVLSLGVQRMARRNVIVRRLAAVETLGSANVIASDKTGTLAKNEMMVRTVITASGRVHLSGSGYDPRGL